MTPPQNTMVSLEVLPRALHQGILHTHMYTTHAQRPSHGKCITRSVLAAAYAVTQWRHTIVCVVPRVLHELTETWWVAYKWVMLQVNSWCRMWMSHVTYSTESDPRTWRKTSQVSRGRVMSLVNTSCHMQQWERDTHVRHHECHVNESCHLWMSHGTRSSERAPRNWRDKSLLNMSRLTAVWTSHDTSVTWSSENASRTWRESSRVSCEWVRHTWIRRAIRESVLSHAAVRALPKPEESHHESHVDWSHYMWIGHATREWVMSHATVRALHELVSHTSPVFMSPSHVTSECVMEHAAVRALHQLAESHHESHTNWSH